MKKFDPHVLLHFVGVSLCVALSVMLGALPQLFPQETAVVLRWAVAAFGATGTMHAVAMAVQARAQTATPQEKFAGEIIARIGQDAMKELLDRAQKEANASRAVTPTNIAYERGYAPVSTVVALVVLVFAVYGVQSACSPAVEQAGAAAPVAGEVVFYEGEVACLLAHAQQGLTAANAACGIDETRQPAAAGVVTLDPGICEARASGCPYVIVRAPPVTEPATGAFVPTLDAPSELNTWAPDALDGGSHG